MAIKTIRVKNFKSFKDVEVRLGDFNVLIGANASGKSNFIRIIEFLRDIQRHGLNNAIQMQGGPEYLTNLNIGAGENLNVEVAGSGRTDVEVVARSKARDIYIGLADAEIAHSFSLATGKRREAFEVVDERLSVKGNFVAVGPGDRGAKPGQRHGKGEVLVTRDGEKVSAELKPPQGVTLEQYEIAPWFAPPNVPRRSLIMELSLFRAGPSLRDAAIYDFDPKLPKKATPITGKAELEEDGNNLAIVLRKINEDGTSKRKLANLLQDLLPFVASLDVERFADKSLLFSLKETYTKKKSLPASLLSDGTLNVTALIVALYFERKPVAVIEEPERNIHPHLISRVVKMMKDASRHKQIIVTTHNPEVVRSADIEDVLLVSRDAEGFSTITRPAEREDVKVFLRNEMGLDELFAQNLLHA